MQRNCIFPGRYEDVLEASRNMLMARNAKRQWYWKSPESRGEKDCM